MMDLIFRIVPKRAAWLVALIIVVVLLTWLARGAYESFGSALPSQVSAQIVRIDTLTLRVRAVESVNARQDESLAAFQRDHFSIYDYLEKIVCMQEAAQGQRPPHECTRIEVRRPPQ